MALGSEWLGEGRGPEGDLDGPPGRDENRSSFLRQVEDVFDGMRGQIDPIESLCELTDQTDADVAH